MHRRLLVTGSRDWTDEEAVRSALTGAYFDLYTQHTLVTLVSGACPTGADRIAEQVWQSFGMPVELHPAQWTVHGGGCWCTDHAKRCAFAGPRRNREMVLSGVDMCLAFPLGMSRGTRGTIRMVQEHGIPLRVFD